MKKYNNKSDYFKDWTTKKLKEEAKGYHQQIHEIGCYGTKDVMNYEGIMAELDKRGIQYSEVLTF